MKMIAGARDALYSTLRLIERHVTGFFPALAAFMTLSFLLAAGAIFLFAQLADEVLEGDTQAFDEAVLQWFQNHRTPGLNRVALEVTALGSGSVIIMVVLLASVFLWLTKHKWSVYVLLLVVLGGKLLNTLLKGGFGRERPSIVESITDVSSQSFPSGHAMSSIVAFGSIAYLIGRLEPSKRLRYTIWTVAILLILAIGATRMYLGVHYPSDIIGGYVAGAAWIFVVAASIKAVRYFADRRPETRAEEHDLQR
jgi:undecaprenyl-diphosphatase